MDYFISDLHFGHKNVIRFCERPFRTVSEMNESMIDLWNKRVTDADRIFVLGDVFLMDPKKASEIIHRLNGYKILIAGNHDRSEKTMLDTGFDEYHKRYEYNIEDVGTGLLIHYPVPDIILESLGYDFSIHGHIHREPISYGTKLNVAVDLHDYGPISRDEVKERLLHLDSASNLESFHASVSEGILSVNMKIRMEDFSGAIDHIYNIMKNHWKGRKE
tara:strand:+ start:579 stop:1232 length:654 start_codon:yes stop_codon:yes gene_type:complete